jgi:hypothetical protein
VEVAPLLPHHRRGRLVEAATGAVGRLRRNRAADSGSLHRGEVRCDLVPRDRLPDDSRSGQGVPLLRPRDRPAPGAGLRRRRDGRASVDVQPGAGSGDADRRRNPPRVLPAVRRGVLHLQPPTLGRRRPGAVAVGGVLGRPHAKAVVPVRAAGDCGGERARRRLLRPQGRPVVDGLSPVARRRRCVRVLQASHGAGAVGGRRDVHAHPRAQGCACGRAQRTPAALVAPHTVLLGRQASRRVVRLVLRLVATANPDRRTMLAGRVFRLG